MLVAIKIDLFSLRAVREALPPLLDLLQEYEVKASFFPALGPDPEASPGLLKRLTGGSSPIAEQAADELKSIVERGHEVGAVPWDLGIWRRLVLDRDAAWTREQLENGVRGFRELFGQAPRFVAAPDFLINADVPLIEADLGFDWALDTRGLLPYRPMTPEGPGRCPQQPVTLPRIEDLRADGESLDDIHQVLFMESQKPLAGHVFNYTAGAPEHLVVLEKLLVMWKGSQREPTDIGHLMSDIDPHTLSCHRQGLMQRGQGGPFQAVQGGPVNDD